MELSEPIVKPVISKKSFQLPPFSVMVGSKVDMQWFSRRLDLNKRGFKRLYLSRLYRPFGDDANFSLTGPMIGAPYAVMILESLIALGAREFVFLGWCGALSPDTNIGDIILPTSAFIEEGTSKHYLLPRSYKSRPSLNLQEKVRKALKLCQVKFQEGPIWTTDAIYRETGQKVRFYQEKKALAVEMEVSALFSVANYHKVHMGAILIVSDDLSSLKWKKGFTDERFKKSRKKAIEGIIRLCHML